MSLFRFGVAVVLSCAAGVGACGARNPSPDPDNELPFGAVATPRHNDTVGRMVDVAGWSADDSAVRVVRVYVDGKYKVSVQPNIPRPDVADKFPTYAASGPNYGWQAVVDLGEEPGAHIIIAQAEDDRGATRDLGSVTVNLIGR